MAGLTLGPFSYWHILIVAIIAATVSWSRR
jgi:hypothetical protein